MLSLKEFCGTVAQFLLLDNALLVSVQKKKVRQGVVFESINGQVMDCLFCKVTYKTLQHYVSSVTRAC